MIHGKIIQHKSILFIIFTVSIYIFISWYSDYRDFSRVLQTVNLTYSPVIIVLVIASIFFKSERQRFLLRILSLNISRSNSFLIFMSSQFLLITPAGSGSLVKSHFLKKKFEHPYPKTIAVVLTERYLDMAAIVTLIVISLMFHYYSTYAIPTIILGILIIIIFFLFRNKRLFLKLSNLMKKIPKASKFSDHVITSHDSIFILSSSKIIAIGWLFSIFCWFVDALAVYLCFLSFNLSTDFFNVVLISFSSLILGVVSLLPGGLGVTEFSMISLLINNQISLSMASALVLYIRLSTTWFPTLLGFIATKKIIFYKYKK